MLNDFISSHFYMCATVPTWLDFRGIVTMKILMSILHATLFFNQVSEFSRSFKQNDDHLYGMPGQPG